MNVVFILIVNFQISIEHIIHLHVAVKHKFEMQFNSPEVTMISNKQHMYMVFKRFRVLYQWQVNCVNIVQRLYCNGSL